MVKWNGRNVCASERAREKERKRVSMCIDTGITIGKCVIQVVREIRSRRFSSSNFAKQTKSELKQENFYTNKSKMIQS